MAFQRHSPTSRQIVIAIICLVIVLGGAFLAASLTQTDKSLFSLSPPPPKDASSGIPMTPVPAEKRLDLYRTFFTAWAALILVTPALCAFLFRRRSESAAQYWLAFWTISFIAFLVHFYWAVVVIFGSDWDTIFHKTTRVSAGLPDTIFTVWWGLDVLLAWLLKSEGILIRLQRTLVHIFAFVLFFVGSAVEGERGLSKALGIGMAAAVLISLILWFVRRSKFPKTMAAETS